MSRDFWPPVFHDSNPSRPLINRLKNFRIRFRFHRDIWIFKKLRGVHPSQWLRGHRVRVVNNYADTMQIILPWNKYKTNEKISKKCNLRFSKIVCQRSHWLRGHGVRRWLSDFRTLRSNIFAKTKKLAKPFLRVLMGPISWHCPFSQSSLFGWKSKKRWVYTVYVIH